MNPLNRPEAQDLYDRLTSARVESLAERDRVEATLKGLESMLSGLLQVFPDLEIDAEATARLTSPDTKPRETDASRPRGGAPTTVRAAAIVVQDLSLDGNAISVHEVAAELARRGWTPRAQEPVAAVRTALNRARNEGLIRAVPLDGRSKGYLPAGETAARTQRLPEPSDPQGGSEGSSPELEQQNNDSALGEPSR